MSGPSDHGPILTDNASHGVECPACGRMTRRWRHLAWEEWIECEHCGFKGYAGDEPVAGPHPTSTSRVPRVPSA